MRLKYYYFAVLFFYLGSFCGYAQFNYKSDITKVDQSGYYNIRLSQEAIALSEKLDLSDFRIKDDQGKEVSYLLRSDEPLREVDRFVECDLTKNLEKDSVNTLIISDKDKNNLSRLYITVRRADVSIEYIVRGSDDLMKWYIVKQRSVVHNTTDSKDDNEVLVIDFPKGNFMHYEITLINNQKNPLNVIRVEKLTNYDIYGNYVLLDLGKFAQKDSTDRKSYITFPDVKYSYTINKIEFGIHGKANYYRNGAVSDNYSHNEFVLSSKSDNIIELHSEIFHAGSVCFSINNNDNPPLVIDSIRAYGLSRYLTAFLEEGHEYYLYYGDKNLAAPRYDIIHFKNELSENIPIVSMGEPQNIAVIKEEKIKEQMWIEKPVVMWSIIIIIGLFLCLLCLKMVKEISKRNES